MGAPDVSRFHRSIAVASLVLALTACGAGDGDKSDGDKSGDGKGGGKGTSGAASGKRGRDAGGRAVPVRAAAAKTEDVPVYLNALGTVTPLSTVTVRSRVDGQLVQVHFREGQMVKEGDLLALVDPRPFQVQLAQAEGQLARDQALLENARVDLDRYQTLLAQDSIASQQVGAQEALVRQYQGTLQTDEAEVASARLQLAYCRLTAPASGRLGLRQIDRGNIVHASDPGGIVVITQVQPIAAIFPIPEDDLASVTRPHDAGQVLVADAFDRAGNTHLATGRLLTADNQIDTSTGTVKLKAEFPNLDGKLFPNQFVNIRLQVATLKGAAVIPEAAVQRGTQGQFVYVIQDDLTVAVRPVTLGPSEGERIVVASGVKPGEKVVVDGADKLREGSPVQLGRPGGPRPPGSPGSPASGAASRSHPPRKTSS